MNLTFTYDPNILFVCVESIFFYCTTTRGEREKLTHTNTYKKNLFSIYFREATWIQVVDQREVRFLKWQSDSVEKKKKKKKKNRLYRSLCNDGATSNGDRVLHKLSRQQQQQQQQQ